MKTVLWRGKLLRCDIHGEVRYGEFLTKDKILLIKTGSKQKRVESDQSTGKMAYPARIGNWV